MPNKRISIRTKLITWLVLEAVAIGAISASSALIQRSIEQSADRLNHTVRPALEIIDSLKVELHDIQRMYLTAIHEYDEEFLSTISDEGDHFKKKLDQLILLEDNKQLRELRKNYDQYLNKGNEICLLFSVTSDIDAIAEDLELFTIQGEKIAAQIRDFSQIKHRQFSSLINTIKSLTQRNSQLAILSFFLILCIIGIFTYVITLTIINPIKKIESVMAKLSKGDLRNRITIRSNQDELESLADSINAMIGNLQEVVKKAQAITAGDFSLRIQPRGKDDELVTTIETMSRQIQERTQDLIASRDILTWEIEEHKKTEDSLKKTLAELQQSTTELNQTQSQLLQAETLASIGQLAAGVAHEINNPVGFIGSNLHSLEEYIKQYNQLNEMYQRVFASLNGHDIPQANGLLAELKHLQASTDYDFIRSDIDNLLKESHDGIKRIRKIVSELRTFSRGNKDTMEYAVVNDVIDNILSLVSNEIKYKAELTKHYGDVPKIKCYPQRLSQVFINMLINAAHAIEKYGAIDIKTYHRNNDVYVQITDNGKGIPEKDLPYIFNPFFTSKPVGQGTGLGLSISFEIVQEHGGDIQVESKVGSGTTFIVRLPIK